MAYTAIQANELLASVATVDQLRELISQLDVAATGSVTLLYSGSTTGFDATNVATSAARSNPDVRIITRTEAAKFLDVESNAALFDKLVELFPDDPDPLDRNSAASAFLFGARDGAGNRVTKGAWDIVSSRFAEETVGAVRAITGYARGDSVFAQSELPALLDNADVTAIDGIARADLIRIRDSLGIEHVKYAVSANSLRQIHFTGLSAANVDAYLGAGADDIARQMQDTAKLAAYNELLQQLKQTDPAKYVDYEAGVSAMRQGGELAALGGMPKVLNRLGLVGGLLSLALAANQAAAADAEGDHERAKDIMKLWAVDSAGSEVGSIVGGVVGGIAVTAAAAAGVALSAPLAGAIVLGAALIGGIFGAEGATELYELTKDKDTNGRRDVIDKLSNLIFGATSTLSTPPPPELLSGQRVTLDATFSREEIVTRAKADIAWRYALRELNPFVVTGVDYSRHNTDGSLDLYDASTGEGAMGERYLQDRAAMLTWKIRFDRGELDADDAPHGGPKPYNADWDTGEIDGNWDFVDLALRLPGGAPLTLAIDGVGLSASDHQVVFGSAQGELVEGGGIADFLYGMAGDDRLEAGDGQDHLDGGAGNDELSGGDGRDRLFGGTGDDTLRGDAEADYLDGGKGFDTYYVMDGDTVVDPDAFGVLFYEPTGQIMTGGTQVEGKDNVYRSDDGQFTYYRSSPDIVHVWTPGATQPIQVNATPTLSPRGRPADDGNGNGGLGLDLKPRTEEPKRPSSAAPFRSAEGTPAPRRDPIVLDLDADGFDTLGHGAGVYFDHDGNGFAELTGWVGADDALLVWDRNADGAVAHGGELVGDMTLLPDGTRAAGGAAVLAYLDAAPGGGNGDGWLDASDAAWTQLRVWRDANSNGFLDQAELLGMSEAGVAALAVDMTLTGSGDGQGNTQVRIGGFQRTDGSASAMGEYLLARDTSVSLMEQVVDLPADIAALPDAQASGNALDLRQAMAQDASGALKSLVQAFASETDAAKRSLLLDPILFQWAGAHSVDPASRGGFFDARKLLVLETFVGETFDGALGADPTAAASIPLLRAYHVLAEGIYAQLLSRTHLRDLMLAIDYQFDAATLTVRPDFTRIQGLLDQELAADPAQGQQTLSEFARMLRGLGTLQSADYQRLREHFASRSEELAIAFDSGGLALVSDTSDSNEIRGTTDGELLAGGDGNDSITAYDGNDILYGQEGDDVLSGCEDDDEIFGGIGNDSLFGGLGNDLLDGGAGGDTLNGGTGDDVYVLSAGIGQDDIVDYDASPGNVDVIRAAAMAVRIWRRSDDLYVGLEGTADALRVRDWFVGTAHRVEQVVLADGTIIGTDELARSRFVGSAAADAIAGSDGGDAIDGLGGDDSLQGGYGDDILDGGPGDDTLYGGFSGHFSWSGAGNDTYLFGRGSGHDVIRDYDTTPGNRDTIRLIELDPDEVTLRREGGSFVIALNDTGETLRMPDWSVGLDYRIERIEFADGTALEGAALVAAYRGTDAADTLVGSGESEAFLGLGGNDSIQAGAGDDTLDGGAGDDTLWGGYAAYTDWAGAGNDTYLFAQGYGQDVIRDRDTTPGNLDTIRLLELDPGEVTLSRDNSSLRIRVNGTADELEVSGWSDVANRVERLEFADGTVLDAAALAAIAFRGTDGADSLDGTQGADALQGLGGDDSLAGMAGDDVLEGGTGNDQLYGGARGVNTSGGYVHGAGLGNDVYVFRRGDGQDTIFDYDATAGNLDTIRLPDLLRSEVTIRRDTSSFFLEIDGSSDRIVIPHWSLGTDYRVERIAFADGSVLEGAALTDTAFLGTEGTDVFTGGAGTDVFRGLGGDDDLAGGGGDDVLDGGAGNDRLHGGTRGVNTSGGFVPGNGAGNDTYTFGPGYGQDEIFDFDPTPGNRDTIQLVDLDAADVTLRRDASTFYLQINGTTDWISIPHWSLGADYRVERVRFADGSELDLTLLASVPIVGTEAGEQLTGTDGDDRIEGRGGNDGLSGGAGNDVLDGGTGDDILRGGVGGYTAGSGAGDDTYLFGSGYGVDTIYDFDATPGNRDTIQLIDLDASDVTIRRDANRLYVEVNGAADRLIVSDWSAGPAYRVERLVFADGSELDYAALVDAPILGTEAAETLTGTAGNDLMRAFGGNDQVNAGTGDDTLYAGDGSDTLRGEDGNDLLYGEQGNDSLFGGNGNDWLDGGIGTDTMQGGAGDDTYVVDLATDRAAEGTGQGIDTVLASIDFSLSLSTTLNLENLTLTGAADLTGTGNNANNVLLGNDGRNTLTGLLGDDRLGGGLGDDRLDGGGGNDLLIGGGGDDSYVFGIGYGRDVAQEAGEGGADTVALGAGIDPAGVVLTAVGADVVVSLAGQTDTLTLGDWFDPASRIEQLRFADGTVWDGATLRGLVNRAPSADPALPAVEVDEDQAALVVLPATAFNDADPDDALALAVSLEGGGSLPAWLTFDPIARTFSGTPRNADVGTLALRITATDIAGATASTTLDLTVVNVNDAPVATGAVPNQIALLDLPFRLDLPAELFVDPDAGDTLTWSAGAGDDPLPAWLSFDPLQRSFSGAPAAADAGTLVVTLRATDLAGAYVTATFEITVPPPPPGVELTGTAGADTLSGGIGDDKLWGLDGSDVLRGGGGRDLMDGGAGNDQLFGDAGADTLIGSAGTDRLDGGAGDDRMAGGAGNDTYYVDAPGDQVIELAGEGTDAIYSAVSYALPDHVESLTLSGMAPIDGTGNALNNSLYGNFAANVLRGGDGADNLSGMGGADTLIGGAGNDQYFLSSMRETIVEEAGGGIDVARASGNFALAPHVEHLVMIGIAVVGTGNELANTIFGNGLNNTILGGAGDDTINGLGGADRMEGGAGDDRYWVDHPGDSVIEQPGEGEDSVTSTVSFRLGEAVENLTLMGGAAYGLGSNVANLIAGTESVNCLTGEGADDTLRGMGGADVLDGGEGQDTLDGGTGNDFLAGGGGDDTLATGAGHNVVAFNRGDGLDGVQAAGSEAAVLSLGGGIAYEDLTLRRSGNDLLVETGEQEGIALKDWYAAPAQQPHLTLQIIAEAMAQFDAASADPLLRSRVQQFDLSALVQRFDAARGADPMLERWSAMNALLDAHLAASDEAALGGDLAYRYGLAGSLAGLGLAAVQDIAGSPQFGSQPQALRPVAELTQGPTLA